MFCCNQCLESVTEVNRWVFWFIAQVNNESRLLLAVVSCVLLSLLNKRWQCFIALLVAGRWDPMVPGIFLMRYKAAVVLTDDRDWWLL